ncbi:MULTISPECIES: hypothetical protein [unclassified Bradyrhizobium]
MSAKLHHCWTSDCFARRDVSPCRATTANHRSCDAHAGEHDVAVGVRNVSGINAQEPIGKLKDHGRDREDQQRLARQQRAKAGWPVMPRALRLRDIVQPARDLVIDDSVVAMLASAIAASSQNSMTGPNQKAVPPAIAATALPDGCK